MRVHLKEEKKQYKCKQKAEYSYRWLEIVKNIEHSYYGLYFSEIREAWKKLSTEMKKVRMSVNVQYKHLQ